MHNRETVQNKPLSLPLMVNESGLSTGQTVEELRMALRTGARRLLFGKHTNELSRMLPPETGTNHIITLVAECRLLHDAEVFRLLAHAIHHRTHLLPEEEPKLEIILTELLTNAIEHGNLGLTATRLEQVDEEDWFERYFTTVRNKLQTAMGRVPVLVTCERSGNEVIVTIEDRGMGFNVAETLNRTLNDTAPVGRGLALVSAWLGNRLTFRNNGRVASFSMPVQPQPGSHLPTRASVREKGTIMVVHHQEIRANTIKRSLNNAGFRNVTVLSNHTQLVEQAEARRPDLILLAVHMPEPDGFKLFNRLKSNPATAGIPVIFFCPANKQNDRNRALHLGGIDVMDALTDPAELSARISGHLYQIHMMRELKTLSGLLEGELDRAKTFQHDLLPGASKLTQISRKYSVNLATHYQGCDTLAGDYWTLIPLDDHRFAFAMADFTGHGTIAALNTVQLHTLLQHETNLTNPTLTTASLNAQLSRLLGKGSFATFIYGIIDARDHTLTYTGSGAPNLILRHTGGKIDILDCHGLPLGLSPDVPIMPRRANMPKGSVLLAYSDALTDTLHHPTPDNPQPRAWEQKGLEKALSGMPANLTAQQTMDTLLHTFHQTAMLPLQDDLTLLAFSFRQEQEEEKSRKR